MKLHHKNEEFEELIELTSNYVNIPVGAVRKDYFITLILKKLSKSKFLDCVVFKGGTSLSKCYPGSIDRFSEDLDLTYIPEEGLSVKQINKRLKAIEKMLIGNAKSEIISEERSDRNKSSFVWFNDEQKEVERVKLEIGCSVRPHPFSKKGFRTYIHEYLGSIEEFEAIKEYHLTDVEVNVLEIQRTFIDKILSVKRHALCATLPNKVRHIYDIVKLYQLEEIQTLLKNTEQLKEIVTLTKATDSVYLEKGGIPKAYNPTESYCFDLWKDKFSDEIKGRYETLHKDLLYTDEKQDFSRAIETFSAIDRRLKTIDE